MRSSLSLLFLPVTLLVLTACGDDDPTDPGPGPGPVVGSIAVTPGLDTLVAIGGTVQLAAAATDTTGAPMPGVTFAWTSSDTTVVTVHPVSGLVTARSNGSAQVAAGSGGVEGAATVAVVQVPTAVVMATGDWTANRLGARRQFEASAVDANGHAVPETSLTWESGSPAVVTLDTAGVATAVGLGATDVVASLGSLGDSARATVTEAAGPPSGLVYSVWFARTDSASAWLVDGQLRVGKYLSEPSPISPWGLGGVTKFQWEGDRIALLTDVVGGEGSLRVRDRVGEWTILSLGGTTDFALEGNRIAQLTPGGGLRVKEGVNGAWSNLAAAGVVGFELHNDLIAALLEDGRLLGKEGINGPWATLATGGVRAFHLGGSERIGVLTTAGDLLLKDGLNSPWTPVSSGTGLEFELSGNRVGLLSEGGTFHVKDGINGPWTLLETGGVEEFDLSAERIIVRRADGVVRAKDGINGAWRVFATGGIERVAVHGNMIGMASATEVRVKQGLDGEWATVASGGLVQQFAPSVDVPVPPFRTTDDAYATSRQACTSNQPVDCRSPIETAHVAPWYARYCGGGRPAEGQEWDKAEAAGPLDAMDALCRHHDYSGLWYPETPFIENMTDSCVVFFGLYHSELSRNGVVLTRGSDSQAAWDAAWGSAMPDLKGAVEAYYSRTSGCPLQNFENETASDN